MSGRLPEIFALNGGLRDEVSDACLDCANANLCMQENVSLFPILVKSNRCEKVRVSSMCAAQTFHVFSLAGIARRSVQSRPRGLRKANGFV
jgi:hypothetical protein